MYKCVVPCTSMEGIEIKKASIWELIERNGDFVKLYAKGREVTISSIKLMLCFGGA